MNVHFRYFFLSPLLVNLFMFYHETIRVAVTKVSTRIPIETGFWRNEPLRNAIK